jgi:NADH dehydrogenase
MSENKPAIVVLGAGYAGLLATVRLAGKQKGADIVLLNPLDFFVERLRLHQYATNQQVKRRPIAGTLRGTSARLVLGEATWIDRTRREVVAKAADGTELRLGYDYLLYALGSSAAADGVPGIREHAYALAQTGPRSAEALRVSLPIVNEERGVVTVVGGGATGIEAAAEFAESYPGLHVSLITRGRLAAPLGSAVQTRLAQGLRRLGVSIIENTAVASIDATQLTTADGSVIPTDLCLWAGGFSVPTLARDVGLAVNERGQALIDPYMRSLSDPRIYAAGDSAAPVESTGAPSRMAAYTAALMGAHAADCLDNALKGKAQQPLSFAYAGQGIALGRHDAVGFSNYPDDKPHRPIFSGWLAMRLREFFVTFLANSPRFERRHPGLFYWFGKSRVQGLSTDWQAPAEPRMAAHGETPS